MFKLKKPKIKLKSVFQKMLPYLTIILLFIATLSGYFLYYSGKIYPNIFVAGISVGGLSPQEAIEKLGYSIKPLDKVVLVHEETVKDISLKEIDTEYDFPETIRAAYEYTRTGNFLYDVGTRINILKNKPNLGLRVSVNEEKLQKIIDDFSEKIGSEPIHPIAAIENKSVVIIQGKDGTIIDKEKARLEIGQNITYLSNSPIRIETRLVNTKLNEEEEQILRSRAEKLMDKSLNLKFEYSNYYIKGNVLLSFLDARKTYDQEKITTYIEEVSSGIDRDPQEPVFVFEEGRVKDFAASKDGVSVKKESLFDLIVGNITLLETGEESSVEIEIPVERKSPKVGTDSVNNLGINELIGRGTSKYVGSIPNRVHNISLATSRFKGILVAPGDTFSFNEKLGDVSEMTGYKQAYVIKEGKTVLGDGGGVCQVSSTLFRAILDAGLPIIERQAHAYRVGYYEQGSAPGFDATVYSPHPDLKFQNDTPGHILIQPAIDLKNYSLIFEIYGTDDGRVSEIGKPVITNQSAPAEDLYIDDPTLPAGTIKQIEHKAWGARVTFTYKVVRNGERLIDRTFVSNYRPWQAVYLRGTGPAI